MENIYKVNERIKIVKEFLEATPSSNGVIKIYDTYYKILKEGYRNCECEYFILMELAEKDLEKEISSRRKSKKHFTEEELFNLMKQLIKTFSILQKNKITHRDVKPQNVLIFTKKKKTDYTYKICDFGESKKVSGDAKFLQTIKGSELYMSPIVFKGLNCNKTQSVHNCYKSDVFSMGMCFFFAASLRIESLYQIREVYDMNEINKTIDRYLDGKYSVTIRKIILKMLQVDEKLRPDFVELERYIDKFYLA